jgi:hypothetical protein
MIVIFPLTVPKAKAVVHLSSTMDEDGDPTYDMDGIMNGIVVWADDDDHIINDPLGYTVDPGYTLEIPNLNYQTGNPAEFVVEFQGLGNRIDVWGTLITNPAPGGVNQWTAFTGGGMGGWDGIYFYPGSQGVIQDVLIQNSQNGIVMEPDSYLIDPFTNTYGVDGSRFEGIYNTGMKMDGVLGYTNINNTNFYLATGPPPVARGMGLEIGYGALNITNSSFNSHGPNLPSLHIIDANVNLDQVLFAGNNEPGYGVFVEGDSNGTVLNDCDFQDGVTNNHYIQVNGSSILINNNTFSIGLGQLSVIANDYFGYPGSPILRNPNPPGTTFDNTTINATGGSNITLQWFLDVYVEDPDGNFISSRPVSVKDRLGNPAQPPSKITDGTGWAREFLVTELIRYNNTIDNYNPFNVSAENNTMIGYAFPKPTIDMSKSVTVIVPFNPIPNTLPIVTQLNLVDPDPQSGLIDVEFKLMDPNPGDNGSLWVEVLFSYDGADWEPATTGPGSGPTSGLLNNTLYTFVWNSSIDLQDIYNITVYIMIIPHDNIRNGTSSQIGPFTVDNKAPVFLTPPTIEVTDTIAWINWTVNESAEASVWYGFTQISPILTTETIGSSGSTFQSVQLTALQPGRDYTFIINSTDPQGNKRSSDPTTYTFKTEIRIYLHKGWNMISFPPYFLIGATIQDTLISIAGQYDAIQAYYPNDPGDPWKHYREGKPYGNDLLDLDEVHGFWIHMKNDTVLIPDHEDPTKDILFPGYTTVLLQRGWNFVGYPSVTNRNVVDALLGVPYDMVKTYDASTHQWLSYDPGGYSTDNLSQMEIGKGYWIHVTSNFHMWNVDYV